MDKPRKSQLDKFKEPARELETDDDEARYDERVEKLVTHKPVLRAGVIAAPALKRRMLLVGFLGSVLTAFLLICLAGFGRIRPQPTLGIIGVLSGSIVLLISTWRWGRRNR